MTKGISINIGINNLSDHYNFGVYQPLLYCANDAAAMANIAYKKHFQIDPIYSKPQPTAEDVTGAIEAASVTLNAEEGGGILLVTFAGHGSQIQRHGTTEPDQTWCLYNRQIIDKELAQLWSLFNEKVRILFISDSCHSGDVVASFTPVQPLDDIAEAGVVAELNELPAFTNHTFAEVITKKIVPNKLFEKIIGKLKKQLSFIGTKSKIFSKIASSERTATRLFEFGDRVISEHYDDIYERVFNGFNPVTIQASVISMSACGNLQDAIEKSGHGIFTAELKRVFNGSLYTNYQTFFDKVKESTSLENRLQTPEIRTLGNNANNVDAFMQKKPFEM
jgi:metacaspase-1